VLDKQVVKGKRAKVLVTVWNEVNRGATGVVVATVRGRQVGTGTLRGGAARIRLPRLKVGTWPVRLAYTGSDTVEAVSKQVKVTVVKPPKRR
jgi:hypothetical protein